MGVKFGPGVMEVRVSLDWAPACGLFHHRNISLALIYQRVVWLEMELLFLGASLKQLLVEAATVPSSQVYTQAGHFIIYIHLDKLLESNSFVIVQHLNTPI